MRISYKQLKKLAVVTQSGVDVGTVKDVVIDTDTHVIVQYEVTPSMLSTHTQLIHHDQVVSISAETMIVQDGALHEGTKGRVTKGNMGTEPAVMREES